MRRQEEKENNKKWIVKGGFYNSIGKAASKKPQYIPNYVNLCPSDPPVNYQFRELKKDKWVGEKSFFP